jgi:caffeoyl-CoA O-methyltransferase
MPSGPVYDILIPTRQNKGKRQTGKMKGFNSLAIFVLVTALAVAATAFVPDWRSGMMNFDNRAWGQDLFASLKNSPLPKTAAEKRILKVLDEIKQGPWMANVATLHGRLLRILTEAVKARNVVEIGTSNGYSALWICLGLQATGGRLVTHEIDPQTAALARVNFQRAGVEPMVTIVLGDAHETVSRLKEPIDLLFIDADKPGYLDYLHQLLPLVRPGGLILADNMNQPKPSPDFVKAITTNPNLETIFLNMQSTGISLTLKKP